MTTSQILLSIKKDGINAITAHKKWNETNIEKTAFQYLFTSHFRNKTLKTLLYGNMLSSLQKRYVTIKTSENKKLLYMKEVFQELMDVL